ncbi:MAG: ribonuclease R [Clostridia bacterium]|nr:ribonuclease R [Clostridia bacterium]
MRKKKLDIEKLNNELSTDAVVGKFVGNERGFGFVEVEGREDDIFISPKDTFGAMNGDTVFVMIKKDSEGTNNLDSSKKKRVEGYITEVLNRANKEVVGTFNKGKDFGFVIADDKKLFQDIYISKQLRKNAKNNDKVVVEITKYPTTKNKAEGKIIEILGKSDDSTTDLMAVIKTYGYKTSFPKEVQDEAKELPQIAMNLEGRKDLRDKEIFTIDGADTKDIDDAISLDCIDDRYILGVHIADVSHYVVDGSALDKEAIKRGTSVYLIDSVIPMLPKELSNGICSLNELEDRYALSIDIELDKDANVIKSNIYKSIICSKKKMTYDDVYKVISGHGIPNGYKPFEKTLLNMKELAIKLKQKRHDLGAIDFDLPEPKVFLDENDDVIEIKPYEITIANQMIEQFMVLANECVAKTFFEKKIPFIYRVHESPDKDKLNKLKILLKNLNYKDNISLEETRPIDIQNAIELSKDKPEEKVVSNIALRSMQLARYSEENLGHFGLALDNYCHFTSPIRRYPDLFIHRVISKYLADELNDKLKAKLLKQAIKYSETSSEMERKAEEAERDLVSIKMCEYMQKHIGEEYAGIISGINNYGLFVELDNTIEGMVHVENMKDDYYNYDEMNCAMIGERTHKIYKIGDSVKIKVISANKMLRRIDFEIIS